MKRRTRLAAATGLTVAALTLAAASVPSSEAAGTGTGSAYSAAANAGTVSSITPAVNVCLLTVLGGGACTTGLSQVTGSLLAPVTALVSAIQQIPSGLVAAVTGSGLSATNPSTQLSRPNPQNDPSTGLPNLPTCGAQGWDANGTGDCYAGLPVAIPASALLGLNVTGVGGYATDDSTGYVGAALTTGVSLSLLGTSVGTVGTVSSSAQCSNDASTPACAAANSAVKASLLPTAAAPTGGLALSIAANGVTPVATVGGVAISPATAPIPVSGLGNVNVALSNQLLTLAITLSPSQLTALLPTLGGLTSLVSAKGTVTIGIGPGSSTTNPAGSATASGLVISADLSLDIKLSVPLLASVEITTGAGITSPNLLNLSLAYSKAVAGTAQASWIAPSLI